MKILIYILLIFISFPTFGQNISKEAFINEIHLSFVDSSSSSYYLSEKCSNLHIGRYDTSRLIDGFREYITDYVLAQLIQKAISDTSKQMWNSDLLIKAQCIDDRTADTILKSYFTATTKSKWSKRKQDRIVNKQVEEQRKKWKSLPIQERTVYYFSRPIFDDNNQFAIISLWSSCGSTCGYGCIFLFKFINQRWVYLAKSNCKMS